MKRFCTKESPFKKEDFVEGDMWEHVDVIDSEPHWRGEIIFLQCVNCGMRLDILPVGRLELKN